MRILYTLLLFFYGVAIQIAALFSEKARTWISGRKKLFERLKPAIDRKSTWIWVHVSSLGEFEQGRPLIEMIRQRHPEVGILLTFFSPSGYLIRKEYPYADYVTYMPLDTPKNAKRFIEIVKPKLAIFIKYDIWYHYLDELEKRKIPTVLVSANLRPDQIYFKPAGKFLEAKLRGLKHIFTQTKSCAEMLGQRGFTNVSHAGDTRVDRVLALAAAPRDFTWLKRFFPGKQILVAGSTWPGDEDKVIPATASTDTVLIIAPHDVHESRIKDLETQLPNAMRLSRLMKHKGTTGGVIVDTIGDLAHLYSIADVAYVGGGFGKGIHNILEPAAYGIPVLFGPNYRKFVEAVSLIERGAARAISTRDGLEEALKHFKETALKEKAQLEIVGYLAEQKGATEKVYEYLISDFGFRISETSAS